MSLRSQQYLDSLNIPYEIVTFADANEKGAPAVANALNGRVTLRQVVKCLVFETSAKDLVLVLVGGDQNVISGELKKTVGDRNIRMASAERIREVSGHDIGAIPPFSWQPEGFSTYIDASLLKESLLAVGAGQWGHEFLISPSDLVRAAHAKIAALTSAAIQQAAPPLVPAVLAAASTTPHRRDPVIAGVREPSVAIRELTQHAEKECLIRGWVYNIRSSGGLMFLQLRDGSGFVQAIVDRSSVSADVWIAAQQLTRESSCIVSGVVRLDRRAPSGVELTVSRVEPVHIAEEFPIAQKEHGPEFLFSMRHLYIRSRRPWAALRIRDEVFYRLIEYFRMKDYVRVDTPVLQPTNCEDSTQLFSVDYFGDPMYLSQSGQLYLETLLHGFGKVYDFGPVFRAEQSKTRKHLCEFWMLDWETPFSDQNGEEEFVEQLLKHVVSCVLKNCREELRILERDTTVLERICGERFIRLELRDATAILNEKYGGAFAPDADLNAEAEERLGEHFGVPVFVKDYPYAVKAFYMQRYSDSDGIDRAICADLVAPEGAGEIATCAVRESSYANLARNLNERGQSVEDYSWYLDVRRYGSVPHAGGGLGPERIIRWLTGVHHIRETIPFPRTLILRQP